MIDNHVNKLKKAIIISGIILFTAIGFLITGYFILGDELMTDVAFFVITLTDGFILGLTYFLAKIENLKEFLHR